MARYLVVLVVLGALTATAPVSLAKDRSAVVLSDSDPHGRNAAVDWLAERLRNARAGQRELVRLPIAIRSVGWGCPCPKAYIGQDPNGDIFSLGWLQIEALDGTDLETTGGEAGAALVAEGWFTGGTVKEDLRSSPDEPDDFIYTLDKIVVARTRPLRDGEPAELRVVLSHPAASEPVTPLSDGRPWLVIAGTVPFTATNHAARAEKLAASVRQAGFEDVEAIDSRRADRLWCCADVVVAGRFATKELAQERERALRKKGLKPYVKQGFDPPTVPAAEATRAPSTPTDAPPTPPASPPTPADAPPN